MKQENVKFEDNWNKIFSESAKSGGEDYKISIWTKEGLSAYISYFIKYFNLYKKNSSPETLVLDMGCGPGTFSRLLKKRGFKVCAVDFSKDMIEIAKEKSQGLNIEYKASSIYHLPYNNNYFDKVICLGVFQTVNEPVRAIKEIRRVLKNDGLLVITTLNKFSLFSLLKVKKQPKLMKYNPYKFKEMIKNCNFHKIKVKGIYFFPASFSFLTTFILKLNIFKYLNIFFPLFMFISHSFHIEGRAIKE